MALTWKRERYPPIQVGVLFIVGESHDVWESPWIDLVLILLHIVGGICEFEGLVPIKGIGYNPGMAPVFISKVPIGCNVWIWH
jgi:hypothetical protein